MDALFTREDYLQLPEGFPAQLIRGSLVKEPSPTYGHQDLVARIWLALRTLAPGRTVLAPYDVFLDDLNVFQPDVAVFADPLPQDDPCDAIPVLVVEVCSPASHARDVAVKRTEYLRAGVPEVWVVHRHSATIEVASGGEIRTYRGDEAARSDAVPGFALTPRDLLAAD
jgi:Uma2 family endonuclease